MSTVLVTFGLLIIEVWILAGIALGLHYLSSRYGISLLLMYAAAIIGIITFANPTIIFVEPIPNIFLTLPGDFFVPTVLVIILVLYIVDGTEITQAVIFGVAIIQILAVLIFAVMGLSVHLPNVTTALEGIAYTDIFAINFKIMIAGILAFIADMFAIAIIYQGTQNLLRNRHRWIAIALSLLGALWTDAIIFTFISTIGGTRFSNLIAGDIISKSIAALTVFPLVALYLYRLSPTLPKNTTPRYRPTFDIVHNLFGSLQQRIEQLESELREQEINARELVTHINEIFWIADERDTEAFLISEAFDRIIGIPRGKLYLQPEMVRDIVLKEDHKLVIGHWLCYQADTHDIEFRTVTADGKELWMRDRTYAVEDEQLGIKRVIGITENITAQKERQALETAITVEREKIQVLHDLVREVSHDIQSPITSLTLKINLIERTKDDSRRRKKYLKDLKNQTFHLSALIEHLFTLIKIESRSNPLLETADINGVCQDVIDEVLPLAEEKKLSVTLIVSQTPVLIHCTAIDIRRVFGNLIGNAIRYTPEDGQITVAITSINGYVHVAIQDTGIGIKPEDLPHIFERFYRASNTTEIAGTGLGLAITRQIIQQHNGRIEVDSEINIGTTFNVYLPLIESQ